MSFLKNTFLLNSQLDRTSLLRRELAMNLIDQALTAIEPRRATRRALESLNGRIDLSNCTIFAFGKAAKGMAQGALEVLSPKRGLVHCFEEGILGPLKLVKSSHPNPAEDALQRGQEMLDLAVSLSSEDLAICLVSGGGSAMLERPISGVSISQMSIEIETLMKSGADINIINERRKQLSAIKGGGLAKALRPAKIITIIISDTPGASLSTVASGPSLPSDITLVAADHLTAQKAILQAQPEFSVWPELLSGEARLVGEKLAQAHPGFVATGETTVSVTGHGRGGRNHEVILGAIKHWKMAGAGKGLLLSLGTDGIDGSSDAAGAWCDEAILQAAPNPSRALENNDAHHYFKNLNAQIVTGPTGTNVADLVLYLP